MGLTIHWQLQYQGNSPQQVLEGLRQKALDMKFEEVGDIVQLPTTGEPNWLDIMAQRYVQLGNQCPTHRGKQKCECSMTQKPVIGYGFNAWPGEGSEDMNIFLCQYPDTKFWHGRGFCKTQYAEYFRKAHLLVISLLDLCKEAGILESVYDEGGYWEKRDVKALLVEVGQWDAVIGRFAQQLKTALGAENVLCAIDQVKSTKDKAGKGETL